jgi:hypothetical protein
MLCGRQGPGTSTPRCRTSSQPLESYHPTHLLIPFFLTVWQVTIRISYGKRGASSSTHPGITGGAQATCVMCRMRHTGMHPDGPPHHIHRQKHTSAGRYAQVNGNAHTGWAHTCCVLAAETPRQSANAPGSAAAVTSDATVTPQSATTPARIRAPASCKLADLTACWEQQLARVWLRRPRNNTRQIWASENHAVPLSSSNTCRVSRAPPGTAMSRSSS